MKTEALFSLKRLLQISTRKETLWHTGKVIPHASLLLTGYVRPWFCLTKLEQYWVKTFLPLLLADFHFCSHASRCTSKSATL